MSHYQLDAWLEGYLAYLLDVRRLKPRSVTDVRCTLRNAAAFFNSHCPGSPLYRLRLQDFLQWVNRERDRGRSEAHIAKCISQLRGMLDYAWRSGRTDRNVLDGFDMKTSYRRKAPAVLAVEEARALVEACQARTAQERRDRMIVLLLYGCGLRTAELASLDIVHVDTERREVFVQRGKGDIQRTVPVPPAVWTELLAYLAEQARRRGPLFRTEAKRKRISSRDIARVVRDASLRAGIETRVTPKTLRHSYATHLMEKGVDIAVISSLLGHRSPSETGVYLHAFDRDRETAVDSLCRRRKKS